MKRKKPKAIQKIYKLLCKDFGHKFSFHAEDDNEALDKKNEWCNYHSFNNRDFMIEETTDTKWIHDEYFN